jgi:type I restriction enzyme S subunit
MGIDIDNQELPHGWIKINLEEAGSWCSGGTPSRKRHEFFGKGIYWIKSGDLTDGLITKVEEQITQEGLENSSAKLLPVDTISIALYGATIGKLGILTFPAATNQACANVVPNKSLVTVRYLFYYLASQKQNLIDKGKGGAQPNISQEILKAHPLLLAPLNEQRRIVAKLEKLLAKVDTCKERLDKIPGILKRFRQSVLSAACSGRLTADWRENNPDVESAEELLKRIQEETTKNKSGKIDDIPDPYQLTYTWKWATLISVCSSITDGDHQAPPKSETGIPFLVISNIKHGDLDFSNTRYVPESYYQSIQESRKPRKGDILYSVVGSYGIPVLVDTNKEFCFQRHIALLKTSCLISNKYLFYILNSDLVFRQATAAATGTAQLTVTLSGLRQIKIPLVPFPEQQEIVNRIETLFKTADRIEQRYQKARTYIDQLTQSILAKAFRGELVPQDPNDEPASVLLERIRAERENRENVAKTAKQPAANKKQRSKKAQSQLEPTPQLEPKPQLEPIQLELPLFD